MLERDEESTYFESYLLRSTTDTRVSRLKSNSSNRMYYNEREIIDFFLKSCRIEDSALAMDPLGLEKHQRSTHIIDLIGEQRASMQISTS